MYFANCVAFAAVFFTL